MSDRTADYLRALYLLLPEGGYFDRADQADHLDNLLHPIAVSRNSLLDRIDAIVSLEDASASGSNTIAGINALVADINGVEAVEEFQFPVLRAGFAAGDLAFDKQWQFVVKITYSAELATIKVALSAAPAHISFYYQAA